MATETKASDSVDINTIPYDAPLSIAEPPSSWVAAQNRKGAEGNHIVLPDADLTGKWVLISGSNNGIGRDAAIQFAAWGANIILACRDPPAKEHHPEEVVKECKAAALEKAHEKSTIEWWELDCTKLSSVEKLAARWLETGRPLDILANNAGIGSSPSSGAVYLTEDGFEIIHQVNLLSHVLLTLRLLPALEKAPAPRVICTTSCFHFLGRYDLTNFNAEHGASMAEGVRYYQNNKLWFQIWVAEMQRRLLQHEQYKHITVNGIHPGYVNSGIWNLNDEKSWLTPVVTGVVKVMAYFLGISTQQGSLAILNAATSADAGADPAIQGVGTEGGKGGGRYFSRTTELEPMPHTKDADCRQRVWRKLNDELKLEEKGLLEVLGLKHVE
jgi:NAD(P)-dependent dehydrogenase (short-subunit alcohol dehydrogenase family)